MGTQKQWSVTECSIIYHLITWGMTNKQVTEAAQGLLPNRTLDGISGQASEIRKYISKKRGFIVSNYTISDTLSNVYYKASKVAASEGLLKFKPEYPGEFIKSQLSQDRQAKVITSKPIEAEQQLELSPVSQFTQPKPEETEKPKPTILDVMRFAKELGAKEVEFEGMKIKY